MSEKELKFLQSRLLKVIDVIIEKNDYVTKCLTQWKQDVKECQSVDELKALHKEIFNFLNL